MSFDFISGNGQRDTKKHTGGVYFEGTFANLVHMAQNPVQVDKVTGNPPWAIFSNHNNSLGRDKLEQKHNGYFTALWLDIDEGDPTQQQVAQAVRNVLGDGYKFVVYHTASTGEVRLDGTAKEKHRVVVPLVAPEVGEAYTAYATALNDAIAEQGLIPDRATESINQLCYLPNRGLRYDAPHLEGHTAFAVVGHPIADRIRTIHARLKQQEEEQRKRAEDYAKGIALETDRSFLAAFRRKHKTADMLALYGWVTKNGRDWKAPCQTTGSYATELHDDDSMYTVSATTKELYGSPTGFFRDTFDIYVHHNCNGDRKMGEAYARQCLAEEDDAKYGDATVEMGQELWDAYVLAEHAHSTSPASLPPVEETIPLSQQAAPFTQTAVAVPKTRAQPEIEGLGSRDGKYVNLPIPGGAVGVIAEWVFTDLMEYPLWDIAITSAWLMCAALAGRKDNYEGIKVGMQVDLGLINGGGKDTIRNCLHTVVAALHAKHSRNQSETAHLETINFLRYLQLCLPVAPSFGSAQTVEHLRERPCCYILTSESGIASKSNAGDTQSVSAGIMQLIMQPAYQMGNFKMVRNNGGQPWGTSIVILNETTKESEGGKSNATISSGEAARGYRVNVDCSRVPQQKSNKRGVPDEVLRICENLVLESMRGEDLSLMSSDKEGICSVKLPPELERSFTGTPVVQQNFVDLYAEDVARRRANKDNEADLAWAHRVRRTQLLKSLCLILARTDAAAYHSNNPVIQEEHYNDATAFIDECRRCEMANSVDYASDFEKLSVTMLETCRKLMKQASDGDLPKGYIDHVKLPKGSPNTPQARQLNAAATAGERLVPISYFVQGRCNASKRAMLALQRNEGGMFRNLGPKEIYMKIINNGDGNVWNYKKEPFECLYIA